MFLKNKKVFLVSLLYFSGIICSIAQSKAHEDSKFAIIDPTYNSKNESPQSSLKKTGVAWIYGPSELECWRLELIQQRNDTAKLKVGYTGAFHKPYKEGSFRLKLRNPQKISFIKFRVVGHGNISINGITVCSFSESPAIQTVMLKKTGQRVSQIQFDINTKDDIPALLVLNKDFSTSNVNWEWKAFTNAWESAFHFPQNIPEVPPHRLEDPLTNLKPVKVKTNLYDFGKELLGYILIKSDVKPVIGVGESEPEAIDLRSKIQEQSTELISVSKGLWRSTSPLCFRYVTVDNSSVQVWTEAISYPETYRGAFACSDSMLTRIWMNSAYTLHMCMHDFLTDGVKRDRLPWAGDMGTSLLVNAYTFADQELVRRTLAVLGHEGIKEKDINGIVDFSLWWIIAQDQYQLYYSDMDHLRREWSRIKETLNILTDNCESNGFLVPRKGTRLFIDWTKQEKWSALQVLWWWAQKSGVKLAERLGDTKAATYWTRQAIILSQNLRKSIWSEKKQLWLTKNDTLSEKTRYPNFLAVVSGLADSSQYPGIKSMLLDRKVKPVGSPYMAGYEMKALTQMGDVDYVLRNIKDYWGGMISKGATTFWEAYNANDSFTKQYSFYNRPYGKSLCHAWSSGPAALLPSEIFGLRPLEDGWRRFTLNPNLGYLQWASVCVPTKYGDITVDINQKEILISIPKGTVLEWKGKSMEGLQILKESL